MTDDATLSASLRIIARDIQSDDGVANACIDEAADRIDELHAEVLRLRMYAPGQRQAHAIRMAPHVGPTNFAAWGITPDEPTAPTEGADHA